MKFYLDTCDIKMIKFYSAFGIIDGVTTNPSILSTHKEKFKNIIQEICEIIQTSVSVEVISTNHKKMIEEGIELTKLGKQIVVKLPCTKDGFQACNELAKQDIAVNMTLCFSPIQAILAAKAGAKYISPFIGRIDDIGHNGISLISEICSIYEKYPDISTKILASSVRSRMHIIESAKLGVDIITISPSLLDNIFSNTLTEKGLEKFLYDWSNN